MPWLSTVFAALEALGGMPRELYTFARGDTMWRLAAGSSSVTVSAWGVTYAPALINRGRLERNAESRGSTIAIRVARTSAVADALRENRLHPMSLRIDRWQPGTGGTAIPVVQAFGDVANVRVEDGWVAFDLETGEKGFGQAFPSKLIQRQCQWTTFGSDSGLDESAFQVSTTISAISTIGRNVITVAGVGGHPDGWFDGGQIKLGSDPAAERVFVRYHVGGVFHIAGRLPLDIMTGATVFLIPGDDKSLATWRDKFGPSAVDRFLGFDLLPATDPLQTGLDKVNIFRAPYAATPPIGSGGDPIASLPAGIDIAAAVSETITVGTIDFTVTDLGGALISIERRFNTSGFAGGWSGWTTLILTPPNVYTAAASKGPAGYVEIEVRITYTDPVDHLVHVVTPPVWEFTSGFDTHQTLSEGFSLCTSAHGADAVCLDFGAVAGSAMVRASLVMTANRALYFTSVDAGDHCRMQIDATAGPFTLTLPAGSRLASDGSPLASLVVNGIANLDWIATAAPSYDWTVL